MEHLQVLEQVHTLIDWWLPRIREALNGRLRAAWLFGSAVLGAYTPGRSDVDVCSVVEDGVAPADGQRIRQVHDAMREHFTTRCAGTFAYRYVIEGQYVPPAIVTSSRAVGDCYVAWGRTREHRHGNPVTPFDRYSLSHHGVCLWGEPARFTPPSREELASQLREDVGSLTHPQPQWLESANWLATMITWTARSMVFWREGRLMGKSPALAHEIAAGSPFADAYRLALAHRLSDPATDATRQAALQEQFARIGEPAAAILRQLAG